MTTGPRVSIRTQMHEVRVSSGGDATLSGCDGPDVHVRGTATADRADVKRARVEVRRRRQQRLREVLVEQKAHRGLLYAAGMASTRRSRSAANARQAKTSSRVTWESWPGVPPRTSHQPDTQVRPRRSIVCPGYRASEANLRIDGDAFELAHHTTIRRPVNPGKRATPAYTAARVLV